MLWVLWVYLEFLLSVGREERQEAVEALHEGRELGVIRRVLPRQLLRRRIFFLLLLGACTTVHATWLLHPCLAVRR
jgi:hypothetical protein